MIFPFVYSATGTVPVPPPPPPPPPGDDDVGVTLPAVDYKGKIVTVSDTGQTAVSDGSKWLYCGAGSQFSETPSGGDGDGDGDGSWPEGQCVKHLEFKYGTGTTCCMCVKGEAKVENGKVKLKATASGCAGCTGGFGGGNPCPYESGCNTGWVEGYTANCRKQTGSIFADVTISAGTSGVKLSSAATTQIDSSGWCNPCTDSCSSTNWGSCQNHGDCVQKCPYGGGCVQGSCNCEEDPNGEYSCFVAGTKITMADGSEKNIEDVKVGESVLSQDSDGNLGSSMVKRLTSPVREGYYEITLEDGTVLKVTDEHPLYYRVGAFEGWASFNPYMTYIDSGMSVNEIYLKKE